MAQKSENPIIDKLFAAGAHFGYSRSRRHPSTSKFIFGAKGGTELIDLEHTAERLEKALAFLKERAAKRETVLFVGSKAEAREALERVARRLNQPFVASRWIGGTLTNFGEIRKRLARLTELSSMREKGELSKFTKRERLLIDREIEELEAMFGGLRGMDKLPNALFIVDPRSEHIAAAEAKHLRIPVMAFLNTDCDASMVSYPIPGNDASRHAVELVLEEAGKAFEAGAAEAPRLNAQAGPAETPAA